jgi:threonine/homoserine/homoserine lactone efflux protein
MANYSLITFTAVYALAVAAPGPGVAAIVARGLAVGGRGAVAFVAGFTLGDLVWMTLTVLGLAALAQAAGGLLTVVRYAGAAYLLYLAWRMWTSKVESLQVEPAGDAGSEVAPLFAGLSLTLSNPKSMVFYLAILPTLVPIAQLGRVGLLQLLAVVLVVNPLILGGYAFAAARAQRLFRDVSSLRWINRITGAALAIVALAVALE